MLNESIKVVEDRESLNIMNMRGVKVIPKSERNYFKLLQRYCNKIKITVF